MSQFNANLSKLTKKVVRHMEAMSQGTQVGGILLAGDPGIGKTNYVELLAQVLGLGAVVIEIPHITEEHVINIPFITFDQQGHTQHGETSVKSDNMRMVLADSHLFTALQSASPMNDQQYLQHIQQAPRHVQELYKSLGGTLEKIPPIVEKARSTHTTILFLDEYYRMTSMRIRNIMRGILNGNIGMHKIPKTVYVMYASNMKDPHSGVEDIPSNHQFNVVEFKPASKDDWFSYLVSRYEQHSHIKLNHTVLDTFKKALKDEDLSYEDAAASVRTSPRRWEQLITYISTSLPAKNMEDATNLMTNVRNNFINYEDETHSDLASKVTKALAEAIEDTSGIEIPHTATSPKSKWRGQLDHAIEQAIKSGGSRKHIPVISGPPGIGKTSAAWQVAEKHNLRLIEIDVSELFSDDAVGMPLPGERGEGGHQIKVKFSAPKLYQQIKNMIAQKERAYIEQLEKEYGENAKAKLDEYKKQPLKYLILFDELNRVDSKTFNSLRRVLLERNFGGKDESTGEELKLPKEALVMGAINPQGAGTETLTQHFRDVVDFIPARAAWDDARKWISSRQFPGIDDDAKELSISLIDKFVSKFEHKGTEHSKDEKAFNIDIGGTHLYVSPREYADMHSTLVREVADVIQEVFSGAETDLKQARQDLNERIGEAFEDSLNMVFYKQNVDMKDEFMAKLKAWVITLPDSAFDVVFTRRAQTGHSFGPVIEKYLRGKDVTKMPDDMDLVNVNNSVGHSELITQIRDKVDQMITNEEEALDLLIDRTEARPVKSGDDITLSSSEKVTKIESLFLALIYTMQIHDMAHDRLQAVGRALAQTAAHLNATLNQTKHLDPYERRALSKALLKLRGDIADAVEAA